jgi:hypothetical protein
MRNSNSNPGRNAFQRFVMPNVGGLAPTHRPNPQTFSAAWAYGRAMLTVHMATQRRQSQLLRAIDNKDFA